MIILRKSNKNDYSNLKLYRSITLLNTLEKILKSMMMNRLKALVEMYELLSDTQYKTWLKRLTETTL